ncbi:phosphopantetheine-binding protein [Streptomyces sp. NPDC101160]|uniref:phosphopantetheine-binding protein n=1 Tax=Streptomyces sp. NPDC101160 TaxID=3366118 RepID=UPI0037FADBD3
MTHSVEETAARIWTEVLRPRPGTEGASFFELGGQSVSALRIAARVESELGAELDIRVLFEDPDQDTFVDAVVRTVAAVTRSNAA